MPDHNLPEDAPRQERHAVSHASPHLLGSSDPFIDRLHTVVRLAVKALSVLMVIVIVWGIFDVLWVMYERLSTPPYFLLSIHDILATFGAFMAVLIAIEIFLNITMYLEHCAIHIRLVLDTAIMAMARKVIVLDFKINDPQQVLAVAAVLAALGVCYWMVLRAEHRNGGDGGSGLACALSVKPRGGSRSRKEEQAGDS